ncbi:MAG: phospholipase D-like domain-containing protein [Planctomycetota bacterium]|jgi:phosphatidylserine/phosphatidylglycerophosphate/cardiolipin synthase-like enzyme
MSRFLRSPFPYVPLGPTELHTEPGATWDRLLADIAGATEEVHIENYIMVDGIAADALITALTKAKSQGAQIRLFLDGAGSYEMSPTLRQRLEDVGELQIYHPLRWKALFFQFRSNFMRRTHRRMVLIDGVIAWTGGLAIEDPWWKEAEAPFREAMIRLCGPVVGQFHQAFETLWKDEVELVSQKQRSIKPEQVRALPQRARRLSHFRFALLHRIGRSHQRAWIATAYFIPPRRLRRALIHAAERGVDVRLLLPGPRLHDHPASRFASRRYYAQLLRHGVKIYEYQPSFQHAKACLFDDHLCIIGTPNIDRWSNLWNHEISVDMHATEINQQLAESFEKGFARSHHITHHSWKARPLWNRFLEYFFGIFDKAF